jgi:hypothetical protein
VEVPTQKHLQETTTPRFSDELFASHDIYNARKWVFAAVASQVEVPKHQKVPCVHLSMRCMVVGQDETAIYQTPWGPHPHHLGDILASEADNALAGGYGMPSILGQSRTSIILYFKVQDHDCAFALTSGGGLRELPRCFALVRGLEGSPLISRFYANPVCVM